MSLRAKSHSDLSAAATVRPPADEGPFRSFSMSSGRWLPAEGKSPPRAARRPVRAVRPLSAAAGSNGSFFQINHLQGELVRKRKECEDLRRENKHLSSEIHMERVVMRTESELTMRTLRSLNQELQAQVKELKQKLYLSQQRATMSSRAADEAEASRGEAELSRAQSEARALGSWRDREAAEAERLDLSHELQALSGEHAALQRALARAEEGRLHARWQLDRVSGEKRVLLQENQSLGSAGEDLRRELSRTGEENLQTQQSEAAWRRRSAAAEQEAELAGRAQREADAQRRLVEEERREAAAENLVWREKHREMADRVKGQEELKALRRDKGCQANIKSYFLCVTESDQQVRILKNRDGSARNFTEGDAPVFLSSPEVTDRSSWRTAVRVSSELPAFGVGGAGGGGGGGAGGGAGGERPDSTPPLRSRKVVDYFWIPTDSE